MVSYLPAKVLKVCVTNKERLCGKGVWLHLDVCSCDLVDKARFAHVGKPGDEEGPCVWIDGWETRQVLPDLLEVLERAFVSAHERGHAAQSRALQLLAAVQ